MSLTVPDHFTIQFGKNFEATTQQKVSRLKKFAIVTAGCTGEAKTHNLVLPGQDEETTGQRYAAYDLKDLDTEKRWNRPRKFRQVTSDDEFDEVLLAPTIMPGGTHVMTHAATYGRRCDKILIEGLLGTNYKGVDGTTAANITQEIPVDYVASGSAVDSGLTADKIIEAVRMLKASEAFNEEAQAMGVKLCGLMNSTLEAQLLQAANKAAGDRLYSRDFMPPVYDANNNLKFWLGVNWVSIEGLRTNTDGTIAESAIWTSDGLHFDIWRDIQTHVDIRTDRDHAVQYVSKYAFAACRHQETQVVKLNCLLPS
jgi:hypothetical protein